MATTWWPYQHMPHAWYMAYVFYNHLQDVTDKIHSHDIKVLMGDMNAQINITGKAWNVFLDHMEQHDRPMTMAGNWFYSVASLCVDNTFYAHKNIHHKT